MLELYGTQWCVYTAELREELRWRGETFVEYDVERDPVALQKMQALCDGDCAVPVLAENMRIVQIGYNGRSCRADPK